MTGRFLTATLYAPTGSFGDIAVGERRGTERRPTRSALLGLLGASLGIERYRCGRAALRQRRLRGGEHGARPRPCPHRLSYGRGADAVMPALHLLTREERAGSRSAVIEETGRAWLRRQVDRSRFRLIGEPSVKSYQRRF